MPGQRDTRAASQGWRSARAPGGGIEPGIRLYLPGRTVWLDTASGSRYRIDPAAGAWAREARDPRSDAVRSLGGPLLGLAAPPRVGLPAVIVGRGFEDPAEIRVITTTPVVRIRRTRPAEPPAALEGWWEAPIGD